jgi:hypothetical protein
MSLANDVTAGIYCGANSNGQFNPNTLLAPQGVVVANRAVWTGRPVTVKRTIS